MAKNVFQLHGVDSRDEVVIKKLLRLNQMIEYFSGLATCDIAMEACGTAHYVKNSELVQRLMAIEGVGPIIYIGSFHKQERNPFFLIAVRNFS